MTRKVICRKGMPVTATGIYTWNKVSIGEDVRFESADNFRLLGRGTVTKVMEEAPGRWRYDAKVTELI